MKLGSAFRFSVRDLLAPGARGTTLAIFMTLAVVCLLTLVAIGLVFGGRRVSYHRLEEDPIALRLLIGHHLDTRGRFSPDMLTNLELQINRSLPEGEKLLAVSPFRVFELDCQSADGNYRSYRMGRTLRLEAGQLFTEHPLIKSRPLKAGKGFTSPEDNGVILCPSMLNDLGFDSAPKKVVFMVKADPISVDVVGVFDRDLPERSVGFVMLEKFQAELQRPDKKATSISTGPLKPGWPTNPAKFPESVTKIFPPNRYEIATPPFDDPPVIDIKLKRFDNEGLEISDWKRMLRQVMDVLDKAYPSDRPDSSEFRESTIRFLDLDYDGKSTGNNKTVSPDYNTNADLFSLYFNRVEHIGTAVGVCEEHTDIPNDYVDRAIADKLAGIHHQTTAQTDILKYFELVLVVMAIVNLSVIQVLRANQKITEAGMLKAIGMSRWGLIRIVVMEVFVIWLIAAAAGIGLGMGGGAYVARRLYESKAEASIGFAWSWIWIMYIFLGSGVISLVSSLLATWRWHANGPARLLSAK